MKIIKTLPIFAILLAAVSAFAFTGKDASLLTDHYGYLQPDCEQTTVLCTDTPQLMFCTYMGRQLYKMNPSQTDCIEPLYRKP